MRLSKLKEFIDPKYFIKYGKLWRRLIYSLGLIFNILSAQVDRYLIIRNIFSEGVFPLFRVISVQFMGFKSFVNYDMPIPIDYLECASYPIRTIVSRVALDMADLITAHKVSKILGAGYK